MMQRGRLTFTLFELLLALALLAALSSLVIGVLLRTDRDHDLLRVQLEALVDISCMHAQQERTALMVWGQSDVVFAQVVGATDEQTPPVYLRTLPGQLSWEEPAPWRSSLLMAQFCLVSPAVWPMVTSSNLARSADK